MSSTSPAGRSTGSGKQAALDAGKSRDWVDRSTEGAVAVSTTRSGPPPLEQGALRTMVEEDYRRYAGAFRPDEARDAAVEDNFAILSLSWDEALASPDIRRYAWSVLRAAVRAKADFQDERPLLMEAAFDTVSQRAQTSIEDRTAQMAENLELFTAISRLPDAHDIMVLRRMRGFTPEKVSDLLGIPVAAVRSDERHATRFLDDTIETSELAPRTGALQGTGGPRPPGTPQDRPAPRGRPDHPPRRHPGPRIGRVGCRGGGPAGAVRDPAQAHPLRRRLDALVLHHEDTTTTTILRVLRRLARHVSRPRSAVVAELMTYMPTAVAAGYLREPESELPLPGPGFARKIRALPGRIRGTARQPRRPPCPLPPRPEARHRPAHAVGPPSG